MGSIPVQSWKTYADMQKHTPKALFHLVSACTPTLRNSTPARRNGVIGAYTLGSSRHKAGLQRLPVTVKLCIHPMKSTASR